MSTSTISHHPAEVNTGHITPEPLNLQEAVDFCRDERSGGLVVFSGDVRNVNHGKEVAHLEYEAYTEMAEKVIRKIINNAIEKWKLHKAWCIHRIGKLDIGESAVVIVTSSKHRKEAYEANQYIIDRVKHEAPIWKKEVYTDGSYEWGNNCSCH